MGIKRWRKVFSEINCLEKSNDEPEDWKSDEICCSVCNTTDQCSDVQKSETINSTNQQTNLSSISNLTKNQLNNYLSKTKSIIPLVNLNSTMTTTPIMTNTNNLINNSDHLNSFNNLISTENMANQNGDNNLPDVKITVGF